MVPTFTKQLPKYEVFSKAPLNRAGQAPPNPKIIQFRTILQNWAQPYFKGLWGILESPL